LLVGRCVKVFLKNSKSGHNPLGNLDFLPKRRKLAKYLSWQKFYICREKVSRLQVSRFQGCAYAWYFERLNQPETLKPATLKP
jgi:hypothetical protein